MAKNKALVSVKVIKGDINRALKKFKKGVMDSGHLLELKERKEYTKPKTIRRTIKQKAIRENKRQLMLEQMEAGEYRVGKKHKK